MFEQIEIDWFCETAGLPPKRSLLRSLEGVTGMVVGAM
jgi:hypothetical protein